MKKYCWSFHNFYGWSKDGFDTIQECIEEANRNKHFVSTELYIGERVKFEVEVDCVDMLERMEAIAWDILRDDDSNYGAENYYAYNPKKQDELDELSEQITKVLKDWQEKYGYEPNFCRITNIRKIDNWIAESEEEQ